MVSNFRNQCTIWKIDIHCYIFEILQLTVLLHYLVFLFNFVFSFCYFIWICYYMYYINTYKIKNTNTYCALCVLQIFVLFSLSYYTC